ncbi:Unknown protein [Striga hermonthica]|uniref:Myb-like domain-containing protein n=1 Tax=Striga hermonthica TaxID=68872 RepID=A0A9N7MTP0_STRHE|nr:Unknown protein [Striga hermonthica]
MWSMSSQYGMSNAFGMPYQQGNFMPTGFSSSPIEVSRPCTIPEVEGLDNICLDTDSEKTKEVEPKRRGKATTMPWTHDEDVLLCRAFCTISSDPVIGPQETSEGFWRRIVQYYNEAGEARNLTQRTMESAKSHFYAFHEDCLKFNASINRQPEEERKPEYLILEITLLALGKMSSLVVMVRTDVCVHQLAKKQQRLGREREKQLQEEAPVHMSTVC